jgi:hypothetical protein
MGRVSPARSGLYRPRRPERPVLHAVVREHFETWLALDREGELDEPGVPGLAERHVHRSCHFREWYRGHRCRGTST